MAQTLYRFRALQEGLGVAVGEVVTFGAGDLLGGLSSESWAFIPEETETVLSRAEENGSYPGPIETVVYNPETNKLVQQPIDDPIPYPVAAVISARAPGAPAEDSVLPYAGLALLAAKVLGFF